MTKSSVALPLSEALFNDHPNLIITGDVELEVNEDQELDFDHSALTTVRGRCRIGNGATIGLTLANRDCQQIDRDNFSLTISQEDEIVGISPPLARKCYECSRIKPL